MINIYSTQMHRLGITPKEYAELCNVPYDIVKVYLNGGDRSNMPLREYFDKVMLSKRNEIEKDKEGVENKVLEEKLNNEALNWFNTEYSYEEFIKRYHQVKKFYDNYDLSINGKTFSYSTIYKVLRRIDGLNESVRRSIIEKIYAIWNDETYCLKKEVNNKESAKKVPLVHYRKVPKQIEDWYKEFDFKDYLSKNNLTVKEFYENNNISCGTCYNFLKKEPSLNPSWIVKFYKIINNEDENNKVEETKEDTNIQVGEYKPFDFFAEPEPLDSNSIKENEENSSTTKLVEQNELLLKFIYNRLTDEEKELVKLFSGREF